MNAEKRETSEQILGFHLVWKVSDHWADVIAYKIVGESSSGLILFDDNDGSGQTSDTRHAEVYLEGYLKWDGCCELDQGCPHWCGPDDFRQHFALLEYLYRRSSELMGRVEPDEPWDRA